MIEPTSKPDLLRAIADLRTLQGTPEEVAALAQRMAAELGGPTQASASELRTPGLQTRGLRLLRKPAGLVSVLALLGAAAWYGANRGPWATSRRVDAALDRSFESLTPRAATGATEAKNWVDGAALAPRAATSAALTPLAADDVALTLRAADGAALTPRAADDASRTPRAFAGASRLLQGAEGEAVSPSASATLAPPHMGGAARREGFAAPLQGHGPPSARPIHPAPFKSSREATTPPLEAAERELALIQSAQTALNGQPERALTLALEHLRAYPRGLFEQEREMVALEAELALHRTAAASDRARRFLARFPHSAHAPRARAALGEQLP
jgi:hypothetical protein